MNMAVTVSMQLTGEYVQVITYPPSGKHLQMG